MQKQRRKLSVFAQEFFDVILHLNTGMDNRPKMSGSDKSKKRQDILETFAAKSLSQCSSGTLRLRWVHKDQRANRKQWVFDFATRNGPIDRGFHRRQATVNRFEVPPPRRRCFQKIDHLLNSLRVTRRVARCGSIA
ncbi:MAG: hypothetical protein WCF72_15200, partial [Pseudolabrys sp.]